MADKSRIEWTEASWNPVVGCSRVSEGCTNCYAIRQAHRIEAMGTTDAYDGTTRKRGNGDLDWTGVVKCLPERLDQPLRWKRPRRIFVNSMSDLFHPAVPFEFVAAVFGVMASVPQHTFQILTKRPERMAAFLDWCVDHDMDTSGPAIWFPFGVATSKYGIGTNEMLRQAIASHPRSTAMGDRWPLPNVWLGTSIENQETAGERIPHLLRCPAAVRWVSAEPLLGPVDLRVVPIPVTGPREIALRRLDWVVVGGESGPGARPMHPEWARSLRDQCQAAGVPFFFKQWGEWAQGRGWGNKDPLWMSVDGHIARNFGREARDNVSYVCMSRVGKKAAGRLLDGREWNEYPGEVPVS